MTQIARSAVFIGFDRLCRQHGLNPQDILRRAGLDPILLRRPDLYVSYARFAHALNLAADEGNAQNFGLELSAYHDYLVLGPFGLLLAQAESFAEVLRLTQQYVHLHAQGIMLHCVQDAGLLRIEYRLQLDEPGDRRQLLELGLGVVQRCMQHLFQDEWRPQRLLMSHACLGEMSEYQRKFPCPVLFEQHCSGFEVEAGTLELKPKEQRSQLKSHLIAQHAFGQYTSVDLPSQISLILQSILPTGEASLPVVARLLDMHPRSLQEVLKRQGQCFRVLLEQARYSEAQQQLRLSAQTVTDLALRLGYADETAFSRAFKRWSGSSPRNWRNINGLTLKNR